MSGVDESETQVFVRLPGVESAVDVTALIPAQAAQTELLPLLRVAAVDPPPERSIRLRDLDDRLLLPEERWWPFVEQGRTASAPVRTTGDAARPPRRGAGTLYGRRRRWLPRARPSAVEVRSVVTVTKITALWLTLFTAVMVVIKIFAP